MAQCLRCHKEFFGVTSLLCLEVCSYFCIVFKVSIRLLLFLPMCTIFLAIHHLPLWRVVPAIIYAWRQTGVIEPCWGCIVKKKSVQTKFWHNVQWCSHVLTQKKCSWLFMKVGLRGQFVHLECAFEFYLSDSCLCSISLCSRGIHLSHCILWNTEQVYPPRASLS